MQWIRNRRRRPRSFTPRLVISLRFLVFILKMMARNIFNCGKIHSLAQPEFLVRAVPLSSRHRQLNYRRQQMTSDQTASAGMPLTLHQEHDKRGADWTSVFSGRKNAPCSCNVWLVTILGRRSEERLQRCDLRTFLAESCTRDSPIFRSISQC